MKSLYETSGMQIPTLNALKKAKYAASFMNDRSWVEIDGKIFEKN